jgi:hypothetical protein
MPVLRRASIALVLLAVQLAIACRSAPRSAESSNAPNTQSSGPSLGPPRDLSQDERAGGHTLKKHVGRTDEQLQERLQHERNISAASTYTDRESAELAIGTTLLQNRDRVSHWLLRPGGHPNLVLDYDSSEPVGRTLRRSESQSAPCSHAVVVLKYNAPTYYVLTSYPECR